MKIIKWVVVPVVIVCAIGFGVYRLGMNYASDKLVDTVSQQLETSGEMEKIKQAIEGDPTLEAFIKDTATQSNQGVAVKQEKTTKAENNANKNEATTTTKLPFDTKEEAIQVVTQKVGMSRLKDLAQGYQDGTTSKEEIIQEVSNKLTEEEIQALKIIAYMEINKK